MKEIIELSLVVFLIYIIANRYILPIFRFTTAANNNMRKMKEQMKNMEKNMNQQPGQPQPKRTVEKEGDYIDYEEVR